MKKLLDPPCICCEYDGENYYAEHSHDSKCPFYKVSGVKRRAALLPYIIRKWGFIVRHFHSIDLEQYEELKNKERRDG